MNTPLASQRVLVTRPRDQAAALIAELHQAGAEVLHRPTLEIQSVEADTSALESVPHWIVWTSPNAVKHGLPLLDESLLQSARLAAVGPGTAAVLTDAGLDVDVAPITGGGAEDLLAEPRFAPKAGERVLIIRGEGGRQRLQQAMTRAGIELAEMAVYRRCRPVGGLDIPADWLTRPLGFTIITSGSGLEHLLGMAGQAALEWVQNSQLVTVSERIARLARDAGFARTRVASGADERALVDTLIAMRQETGHDR